MSVSDLKAMAICSFRHSEQALCTVSLCFLFSFIILTLKFLDLSQLNGIVIISGHNGHANSTEYKLV